jgi:hypothetical protein
VRRRLSHFLLDAPDETSPFPGLDLGFPSLLIEPIPKVNAMSKVDYYIGKFLNGVQYSVEHMTVTHWCILGSMSVVLGFLFLRSTNNRI